MITVTLEAPTKAVAHLDGKEVGSLHFSTNRLHFHPRILYVRFVGSESARLAEVAGALYETVLRALEPRDPLLLYTGADEDSPLLPVLRALGFREFRRVYLPTLEVPSFGLSSLDAEVNRTAALGYRVVSLRELEPSDRTKQALFGLFCEVYADTSTVVPATPQPYSPAGWWEDFILDEAIIPEAFFVALQGNDMAGFGTLYRGEQEGELETGTFGTARRHRNYHRDLMLAVKAHEIDYAQTHGYRTLRAEIDADNPLILQVCAELPFVQGKDYISLVKVLNWFVK